VGDLVPPYFKNCRGRRYHPRSSKNQSGVEMGWLGSDNPSFYIFFVTYWFKRGEDGVADGAWTRDNRNHNPFS